MWRFDFGAVSTTSMKFIMNQYPRFDAGDDDVAVLGQPPLAPHALLDPTLFTSPPLRKERTPQQVLKTFTYQNLDWRV
jgi:hypothetical protein